MQRKQKKISLTNMKQKQTTFDDNTELNENKKYTK